MNEVLLIHHCANLGGASKSFINLVDFLSSDFKVTVLLPNSGSKYIYKEFENKNINLKLIKKTIPTFSYYSGNSSIFSFGFWKGILAWKNIFYWKNLINNISPDMVILNSSVLAPFGSIINKKIKSICIVRETFLEKKYGLREKIKIKSLNNFFDGVVFLSDYDKNYAKLNNPETIVIKNTLSKNSKKKITKDIACEKLDIENVFNVLYVGGLSKLKGIHIIVKAFDQIPKDNNINLLLAGNLKNKIKFNYELKQKVYKVLKYKKYVYKKEVLNKIKNNINIIPLGLQEDMSTVYSASDILVVPSTKPHQSRPAFEAGYYNLPVIITDYLQTKDFVKDKYNGLVFKPNSPTDLFKKLLNYIKKMILELS